MADSTDQSSALLDVDVPELDQFNVYRPVGDEQLEKSLGVATSANEPPDSVVFELKLQASKQSEGVLARAIACRCYSGRYWDLSVRPQNRTPRVLRARSVWKSAETRSKFAPSDSGNSTFLNTPSELCDVIYDQLVGKGHSDDLTGVIVMSGATNSGKSLIVRGLLHRYLFDQLRIEKQLTSRRKPHLITAEDPIESYLVNSPEDLRGTSLDYTPRELGRDVRSLTDALRDALRQQPTALFVGEVRSPSDWAEILQYAGTGHLVITTTHANSLLGTMSTILRSVDAGTPTKRLGVAARLVGVVHLSAMSIGDVRAVIPALWRRTPESIGALAADGLSSVIPANPQSTPSATIGSLSRTWFARALLEQSSKRVRGDSNSLAAGLLRRTIDLDLEGL